MANCYCTKLYELNQKKADLTNAKKFVKSAKDNGHNTVTVLNTSSSYYKRAFSFMKQEEEVANTLKSHYDKASEDISNSYTKISSELSKVKEDITYYKNLDKEYHKEQEKKEKESK